MGLRAKFNLAVLVAFIVGFTGAGLFLHQVFIDHAREQVLQEARIMLSAANAIRHYTTKEIAPIIATSSSDRFFAAQVPSFAAQTNFREVQQSFPAFTYKEAALNPTNPLDRTTDWEADIVNTFRRESDRQEMITERDTPTGRTLNLARPLVIEDADCLTCHSVPARSPAAMTAVYGTANGYGWQLHETIGAQVVSVPEAVPLKRAWRAYLGVMGILLGMFLVITAILNVLLHYLIIRPVLRVASVANEVSLGNFDVEEYDRPGRDEISSLAASFNRMRRSLESAMKMLEAPGDPRA